MRLLVVDGNSLLFRAAASSSGPAGIVAGFLWLVEKTVNLTTPDAVVFVFDHRGAQHWRRRLYPRYKESRPKDRTDSGIDLDDLERQADIVRKYLRLLGSTVLHIPHMEGDDVVGLAATLGRQVYDSVVIATQDRDFYQLLTDPGIKLFDGIRKIWEDHETIQRTSSYPVRSWRLYAALSGGGGDDIPHPKGIGPLKASSVASFYSTPDQLYQPEVRGAYLASKAKWKVSLMSEENEATVRLAYRLIGICTVDSHEELLSSDLKAFCEAFCTLKASRLDASSLLNLHRISVVPPGILSVNPNLEAIAWERLSTSMSSETTGPS